MEIKSIKIKGKNPNLFLIETDEGTFDFHSDAIVKFGLSVGEFDAQKFTKAKEESEIIIALNKVLKYINNRTKTEKQIKDYLYKAGYKSNVVKPVLEKLRGYGFINDNTYAQSYINSNPNFSRKKLKMKLQSAGVKAENFEAELGEVNELTSAVRTVEKFFATHTADQKNVEKITRRLVSQGYEWDTIKQALRDITNGADEN